MSTGLAGEGHGMGTMREAENEVRDDEPRPIYIGDEIAGCIDDDTYQEYNYPDNGVPDLGTKSLTMETSILAVQRDG